MSSNTSKRKGRKKGKVVPETDSEGLINDGFEMDDVAEDKANNK